MWNPLLEEHVRFVYQANGDKFVRIGGVPADQEEALYRQLEDIYATQIIPNMYSSYVAWKLGERPRQKLAHIVKVLGWYDLEWQLEELREQFDRSRATLEELGIDLREVDRLARRG